MRPPPPGSGWALRQHAHRIFKLQALIEWSCSEMWAISVRSCSGNDQRQCGTKSEKESLYRVEYINIGYVNEIDIEYELL